MRAYRKPMDRPIVSKCRKKFWLIISASFLLWLFFLYISNSNNFLVTELPDTDNHNLFSQKIGDITESAKDLNVVEHEEELVDGRIKNGNNPTNIFPVKNDGFEIVSQNRKIEPQSVRRSSSSTEKQEKADADDDEVSNLNEDLADLVSDIDSDFDCNGRYIYIHDLPTKFNKDLLINCRSLTNWTNMCDYTENMGLGLHLPNTEKVFANTGWFATNQFLLEVIFHNRMKQYKCLTNDSSKASAIFVPYYAGLDVSRYLWGYSAATRDAGSLDLVKWLREKPEWKKMWGRDHFLVAGRITWDFRRADDGVSDDWGNRFLLLPESKNMTNLVIEKSPWNNNDFAIPYPTYFHPSNDDEVSQLQRRMRRQKRRFLFSFAGAPRPDRQDSIRNEIIEQCRATPRRKCKMLECDIRGNKCHKPVFVMKMFQSSVFCIQPPGDSYTRRSTFDSILAGCIPVFFHPGSAYIQYLWHLPKDYTRYSVFISGKDVKDGKISIEKILHRIPKSKVVTMREEVIRMIPRVIYADPRSRLENFEDAFDITVKGVLERVDKLRQELREGANSSSFDFGEEVTWKYSLFGTVDEHEWDHFFYKRNG